jgi:hypothetical protein
MKIQINNFKFLISFENTFWHVELYFCYNFSVLDILFDLHSTGEVSERTL